MALFIIITTTQPPPSSKQTPQLTTLPPQRLRCWAIANINHTDVTWSYTRYQLWTQVELSIGIICACLPTLQPVVNASIGPCFGLLATFHSTKKTSSSSSSGARSKYWRGGSTKSGGSGRNQGDGGGRGNGQWNRFEDGKAGLAPANHTTTSAWTMDAADSDDAVPLKGIRVEKDLEQNLQGGLRPGMAV